MDGEGRRLGVLSWVLAATPLTLVALFASLGIHIRLGLGHWPKPMTENYDNPWFQAHDTFFMWYLVFGLWLAGPLWLGCIIVGRNRPSIRRAFGSQAWTIFAGCALAIAVVAADPYRFVEWFLD